MAGEFVTKQAADFMAKLTELREEYARLHYYDKLEIWRLLVIDKNLYMYYDTVAWHDVAFGFELALFVDHRRAYNMQGSLLHVAEMHWFGK